MNRDSGYGTNGAPFEYAVSEAKSKTLLFKRITLIALYCLWAGGWLFVGFWFQLIVPFLALIPLTLWIIVLLTWQFTQIEYEYSFFAGVLTVCRIRGGRSRKKLAEITIREIAEFYPCTEEFASKIDAFREEKTIFAASSVSATGLCVALWNDEENGKTALYFEPNEKALKILKYYNPSTARFIK
ncbi:MAG: hypothetical protein IJW49_03870 [Clostridia bacterium]|nr:hypothetical protein [Clostridia bacterium]